ncbi:MAG: DUF4124 domain-containing protein [Burkholderiales bacterium]
MIKFFILLAQGAALLALSAGVFADIYQWKDADGRTQYSDQPPSDRPARLIKSGVPAQIVAEKTDVGGEEKAEKKGPKSLAEKDQESRKRKIDAEKGEKEAADKVAAKKENCTQARNQMKTLEDGGRIYKRDEKGEKNYLDDKGVAKEMAEAKANVSKYCNS